jgi:hypothetical protein
MAWSKTTSGSARDETRPRNGHQNKAEHTRDFYIMAWFNTAGVRAHAVPRPTVSFLSALIDGQTNTLNALFRRCGFDLQAVDLISTDPGRRRQALSVP